MNRVIRGKVREYNPATGKLPTPKGSKPQSKVVEARNP
jgi:hypothetical protein